MAGQAAGPSEFRLESEQDVEDARSGVPMDSWGEWTEWTRCSRECGRGRQSRMRDCLFENKAKINCSGERVQIQECNIHECPGETQKFMLLCCYH